MMKFQKSMNYRKFFWGVTKTHLKILFTHER